jgi:hypothetical protein
MKDPSAERKPSRAERSRGRHQIDENLRRVYEDMVDDDIPDRFLELLRKLQDREDAE